MIRKYSQLILYGLIFVTIVFIDQFTKRLAFYSQDIHRYRVGSFLRFDVHFNRGISWGILDSQNTVTFVILSMLIVFITLLLGVEGFFRWKRGEVIIGEVMAVAGSLSNIIDRIFYGGVLDFILLSLGQWSWPLFNIADVCIVAGIFLILGSCWWRGKI